VKSGCYANSRAPEDFESLCNPPFNRTESSDKFLTSGGTKRKAAQASSGILSHVSILSYCVQGVTVNIVLLFAIPPAVVTPIFPVFAPVGTAAVICVPEFTV
jgi:hypothetical protein